MKKIKQLKKRVIMTKKFSASLLSVFILGLVSPMFLYMAEAKLSNEEITRLKNQVSDQESIVTVRLRNLQACRAYCISDCQTEEGRDPTSCTNPMCDASNCRQAKGEYNEQHRKLKTLTTRFIEALGKQEQIATKPDGDNESPLTEVRKKKNEMKGFAILGAGTTAILAMKAYHCCSENPGCATSNWCPAHWMGMAAAAGAATVSMWNKRSDLRKTEQANVCGELS